MLGRPIISAQRIEGNPQPHNIQRHRRPGMVVGAIDDESGSAHDIHGLVNPRAWLDFAEGEQPVGAEDEQGRHPSGDRNKCLQRHAGTEAGAAASRNLSSLRTSQRLNTACKVTLATEVYQTWIIAKCGCLDIHSTGRTKLTNRLAELITAGPVLPRP